MTRLDIASNQLYGWIYLQDLPTTIRTFKVSNNSLDGLLLLEQLQFTPSLEVFSVERNYFYGAITLTSLPGTLRTLRLGSNQFTGTPQLSSLPSNISTLDLSYNLFCGNMIIPHCYENTFLEGMCDEGWGTNMDPFGINPTGCNNTQATSFSCPPCSTPAPTMSDLDRMLAFTKNWYPQDPSWNSSVPACSWVGVTCNGDQRVVGFKWTNAGSNGTLDFDMLPRELITLDLSSNAFSRVVAGWNIPQNLSIIILARNKLIRGLYELPWLLKHYDISGNGINGTFYTWNLPGNLTYLDISDNEYSGAFDPMSLPKYLETFRANNNNFNGTPFLKALPKYLKTLDLSNNNFCGAMSLRYCPGDMNFDNMCKGGVSPTRINPAQCNTPNVLANFTCPPCRGIIPDSTQTLLLVNLTQDWTYKSPTWDIDNDACNWAGVSCDNNMNVVRFDSYASYSSNGTFNARFLPRTLQHLYLDMPYLTGYLDTAAMPRGLLTLNLQSCSQLQGPVFFKDLPPTMTSIKIMYTSLCGDLDFGVLPSTLHELTLWYNKFSGELKNIDKLPPKLEELALFGNYFWGKPDLSKLPSTLRTLDLGNNSFCGTMTVSPCPADEIGIGNMCDGRHNPMNLPNDTSYFTCTAQVNTLACPVCMAPPTPPACAGTLPPAPTPAPNPPGAPGSSNEGLSGGAKFGISMAVILPVAGFVFFLYKKGIIGRSYTSINDDRSKNIV
jgi:Leucine-rich repeat (LRR) protein